MINSGLVVIIGFLAVAICWLLFAAFKLRQKNEIILRQSKEIEAQFGLLEQRKNELDELFHQNKQIISVVSHDLKGPFNRIFALVHLMSLSAENFTPDQKEYLNKIHQVVADGLGMIRNLLDNRRLEDKGIEFFNEKLNLVTLLGSLVKNYQTLAEKKGIRIQFTAPPHAILLADKLYLTRVFENLLSNALKFTEPGRQIFVAITDEPESVQTTIRDEGPGISAEDQRKLYHKLQRLTARPTGGESSTGLGLWIVKTILDKMDGSIECESSHEGTTFMVKLKKKLPS
jgi:two-component system sensor histidine kinase/response regulator